MTLVLTKQWQMKRNFFVDFLCFSSFLWLIRPQRKLQVTHTLFLSLHLFLNLHFMLLFLFWRNGKWSIVEPEALKLLYISYNIDIDGRASLLSTLSLSLVGFIYIWKLIAVIKPLSSWATTWDWTNYKSTEVATYSIN